MLAANDCSIQYHTDEVTTSINPILMQISMTASENAALNFTPEYMKKEFLMNKPLRFICMCEQATATHDSCVNYKNIAL